jgi:hypothetical protein
VHEFDADEHAVAADCLGQEPFGGLLIALFYQQKINGLVPSYLRRDRGKTIDLDIGLVHAPTDPHRALTPVKRLFQLGTVLHDLALDGRVVGRSPALLHEFFDM